MKIEIEVTDDNAYNVGWLAFLLGMDQPEDEEQAHGFTMAMRTPGLAPVRKVFTGMDEAGVPVYRVIAAKAKATAVRE